jgi:S-adenosylmethionine:tRNA ribosyltransferase-isomerase
MSPPRGDMPAALPMSDFDYHLPEELVAQEPLERRDASRLMVLDRSERSIEHRWFPDITKYLNPGDLLVINDTRVIPARLHARRVTGGAVEILLLRPDGGGVWQALARPARRLRAGELIELLSRDGEESGAHVEVVGHLAAGRVEVRLGESVERALGRFGNVPLPPYIRREIADPERYQTVFAREEGSAAAPTAGLHFTNELLAEIRSLGVRIANVTLHVGLGTFQPVQVEDALAHQMHAEEYFVSARTLGEVRAARDRGSRVFAVGTTSCRTLESIAERIDESGDLHGDTDLYITPGYRFSVVDAMITNFHLPRSTLLLMMSAFAGRDFVLSAYQEAIRQRYRFFSFGDAMLVL